MTIVLVSICISLYKHYIYIFHFYRCCSKWLTVIHTYLTCSDMQNPHIGSNLGFSILPEDTSTCRSEESNQQPSDKKTLALSLSRSCSLSGRAPKKHKTTQKKRIMSSDMRLDSLSQTRPSFYINVCHHDAPWLCSYETFDFWYIFRCRLLMKSRGKKYKYFIISSNTSVLWHYQLSHLLLIRNSWDKSYWFYL